MAKKKVEVVKEVKVEAKVEVKSECAFCHAPVNESHVVERGMKFCSPGCANS